MKKQKLCKDTESKIFFPIINFQENIEKAQKYYDSLELIYNYFNKFFPKTKNADLKNLDKIKNELNNKNLQEFKDKQGDDYISKFKSEAEKGLKLLESIIFNEFYENLKDENDEIERFKKSKENFEELKKLGNNCNLNILGKEIREGIINAIYKNENLLNNELDFIQNYFEFNENNHFDKKIIKNDIIILIEKKPKKEDDINEYFKGEENDIFEDNDKKAEIENKLNSRANECFDNSRLFDIKDKDHLEYLYKHFSNFYTYIFSEKLGNYFIKEIYMKIISLSDNVYYFAKNLGLFDNIPYKDEPALISEFNYAIQIIKKYNKINKKIFKDFFNVFNKIYKSNKNNLDDDFQNDIVKFLKIFEENKFINLNDIYQEIFGYELIKNPKLVNFIIKDNKYSIPIIDIIFKNYKFDDFFAIREGYVRQISQKSKENNLREMLLFYFENKILNENKKVDKNFYENYSKLLKKCIDCLVKEKSEELSKLYSMAFIKISIYKLINYLYSCDEIFEKGEDIFNDVIGFGYNLDDKNKNLTKIKNSIQMYILKLKLCPIHYAFYSVNFVFTCI